MAKPVATAGILTAETREIDPRRNAVEVLAGLRRNIPEFGSRDGGSVETAGVVTAESREIDPRGTDIGGVSP